MSHNRILIATALLASFTLINPQLAHAKAEEQNAGVPAEVASGVDCSQCSQCQVAAQEDSVADMVEALGGDGTDTTMTGDPDKDLVKNLTISLKNNISMASAIIAQTQDSNLTELAKNIADEQRKHLQVLDAWSASKVNNE
jgi:uncharacterized protein (DUF305 family)